MSLLQLNKLGRDARGELPMILQAEKWECSLACLAMISGYHGLETDLPTLRARLDVSARGATLGQVVELAERMHLSARAIRVEPEELDKLTLPCILHWEMTHFVVLREVHAKWVIVHDPAFGVRKVSADPLSKSFTGVAMELTPRPDFKPGKQIREVNLTSILGRLHGLKSALTHVFLVAIILEVVTLVLPMFAQWAIDTAVTDGDRDLLVLLGLGFMMLVFVQGALGFLRSWALQYVGASFNIQWLTNIFGHTLRLPLSFFEKRHLGDVVMRFGAAQTVQKTLTNSFVEVIIDGMMALTTVVMMAVYSFTLTAVTLAAVLGYALLRALMLGPIRKATDDYISFLGRQQTFFLESLRVVQALKLFSKEEQRRHLWHNNAVSVANHDITVQRLSLILRTSQTVLYGLERVLVVWLGALIIIDGSLSVGMLVAYIAYKEQFSSRFGGLVDKLSDFKMLRLHAANVAEIVHTPTEDYEGSVEIDKRSVPSLDVRSVSFRYGASEPYVLKDFSLSIGAGECIALVGPSGAGKTTLLKIMTGLISPQTGSVEVAGVPLTKLGQRQYRELFGAVMQDDSLLQGTVAENITFFDLMPDMERMEECARLAAIHKEIIAMPMAYNTRVGDLGSTLSGGQKQRVLLARALYKQPKILFLDEATSHLDVANEHAINEAIRGLNLTRIMIAHRPDTIALADRVIPIQGAGVFREPRKAVSA